MSIKPDYSIREELRSTGGELHQCHPQAAPSLGRPRRQPSTPNSSTACLLSHQKSHLPSASFSACISMAPPLCLSIESYFEPKTITSQGQGKPPKSPPAWSPTNQPSSHTISDTGDGFSAYELAKASEPESSLEANRQWVSGVGYQHVDIDDLHPGPRRVRIQGRVVNFRHYLQGMKKPPAARGCWRILVKDDTGVISVRKASSPK